MAKTAWTENAAFDATLDPYDTTGIYDTTGSYDAADYTLLKPTLTTWTTIEP